MKKYPVLHYKMMLVLSLFTFITVGCQKGIQLFPHANPPAIEQDAPITTTPSAQKEKPKESTQNTSGPSISKNTVPIFEPKHEQQTEQSINVDKKEDSQTPQSNEAVSSTTTSEHPALAGIQIGDYQDDVLALHGRPVIEETMADEQTSLSIHLYDGFNVGFNNDGRVEYVEITAAKFDPGLHGLKLGQTAKEAMHALGKPTKNTQFVLSYITNDVMLKLDIDPVHDEINSIKLFAAS